MLDEQGASEVEGFLCSACVYPFEAFLPSKFSLREIAGGEETLLVPTSFLSLPDLKGGVADLGWERGSVLLNPRAG